MTNKEAVAILTEAKYKFLDNQFIAFTGYELEAIDIAISAIQQQDRYSNLKETYSKW